MLLATQIRSFLIPRRIWEMGSTSSPHLPHLALVAMDALAIERRLHKKVNLHNEERRYTLCCERMQGIVEELSYVNDEPLPCQTWHPQRTDIGPTALAYLATMEVIIRWMRNNLGNEDKKNVRYIRFPYNFFPPDDAEPYFTEFQLLRQNKDIDSLFDMAAQAAGFNKNSVSLSASECKQAFEQRLEFGRKQFEEDCGIVDVLDLV